MYVNRNLLEMMWTKFFRIEWMKINKVFECKNRFWMSALNSFTFAVTCSKILSFFLFIIHSFSHLFIRCLILPNEIYSMVNVCSCFVRVIYKYSIHMCICMCVSVYMDDIMHVCILCWLMISFYGAFKWERRGSKLFVFNIKHLRMLY